MLSSTASSYPARMRDAPGDERPAPETSLGAAGRDPIALARQAYRETEAEAERAADIVRHDPSFCASLAAGGEVHLARAPSVLRRTETLADLTLFLAGGGFVAVLFAVIVLFGGRS